MKQKMKTHKGAAKRFKVTKNKKIIAAKSCNNHLLTNKGENREKYTYGKVLSNTHTKAIKYLLPYKVK